jgi:hypothetical protein
MIASSQSHLSAVLKLHMLHTKLCIYEHNLTLSPTKDQSSDSYNQIERIEGLWACVNVIKNFYSTFFDDVFFPISMYPYLSMTAYVPLAHCIVALFRLSTFESPDIAWDRQRIVKEELDFAKMVSTWQERWARVVEEAGLITESDEEDPWRITGRTLSVMLNIWHTKILPKITSTENAVVLEGLTSIDAASMPNLQTVDGVDFANMNLDYLDDRWINDILTGGQEYLREPYF